MRVRFAEVPSQEAALRALAEQAQASVEDPLVRRTALEIIASCESRDDDCELAAIYDAVKRGHPGVEALRNGFKYVADPRSTDYFVSPRRNLEWCMNGACGGDCDDHAQLIAALAGSVGFKVGLRAWGPEEKGPFSDRENGYSHVYAVVGVPKKRPREALGMDTTVDRADVGWEPPGGRRLTAWLGGGR